VPNTIAPPAVAQGERSRSKRFVVIGVIVAAVVAVLLWRGVFRSSVPDNVLVLSGRIEGDDAAVAAKTGGRILEVKVHEGDSVNAGDVVATLDDEQVRARVERAQAALAESEAKASAAQKQIAVLEEQLRQAQLQTDQARVDAAGRVSEGEADVAAAEAQLAREQAALQIAEFDRDAYTRLAESGAVSQRQSRQAVSAAAQQAAAVAAAQRRVEAAKAGLATARANLANPDIRAAQVAATRRQITQQQAEVASAMAQVEQARTRVTEAEADRDDLMIKAPFSGTVVTRTSEPGEVVVAGMPVITLVDLSRVYLRGFIPEGNIGAVKVGQSARVYLDSDPQRPIDAVVSRIDPEATFTPENTYFRDDRVKQVVGVKLTLKGATGLAKPGMPADGEILVRGTWPFDHRQ
jgi:HlyD family secretion protein